MKERERKRERRLGFQRSGWKWCAVLCPHSFTIIQSQVVHNFKESEKCSLALWLGRKFSEHNNLPHLDIVWSELMSKISQPCVTQITLYFLLCNRSRCVAKEPRIPYLGQRSRSFLYFRCQEIEEINELCHLFLKGWKECGSYSQIEKYRPILPDTIKLN